MKFLSTLLFLSFVLAGYHAEDSDAKPAAAEVVEDVFYFQQRLVNLPTGVNLKKYDLGFGILHRFNANQRDHSQTTAAEFFGIDLGSQVAFELLFGVTDWIMVGVHRTSVNKNLEGFAQVALLNEYGQGDFDLFRKNWVSLTLKAGYASGLREDIEDKASGNFQAIVARDLFSGYLHLYVVPSFTTRAHYSVDRARSIGMVGIGAYVAPLGINSGFRLVGEYAIPYRKYNQYTDGWGFGVDFVTGDHTFAIIVANSTGTTLDLNAQGTNQNEWHMGFNITRRFFPFLPRSKGE